MEVLNILLSITIYSGVIFSATMLVKKLFKNKMSPVMHFAVWMLLIVRLLVPVTIASPVHLFVFPTQEQSQNAPAASEPQQYLNTMPQTDTGKAAPSIAAQQKAYDTQEQPAAMSQPAASSVMEPAMTLSITQVLLIVWLVGAGAFLLYLAIVYIALRRTTNRRAAAPSKRLIALFEEVKAELKIKEKVKLICQYQYGMPSLMFPGTILMPFDALVTMNDEQVKFALRHELTHLKRGDHVVSILLSLLLAVYWFNPFVWLAFRQIHLDMETACDSEAVRCLDNLARSRYAALIVGLFAQSKYKGAVLGAAQGNTKKIAERRVRGIFMDSRSRGGVKLVSALAAAVLFVACFTTACQPIAQAEATGSLQPSAQAAQMPPVSAAPADASSAASATLEEEKVNAPTLVYRNTGHLKDAVQSGKLNINIDADVLTPNVEKYPVVQVSPANMTQQEVDRLVNYFAAGKKLYVFPEQKTKAQWQAVWDKESKNDPNADQDLAFLKNEIKNAPALAQRKYTDATLTYYWQDDGTPDKSRGKNFVSVGVEDDAGGAVISSHNYTGRGDGSGTEFSWKSVGGFETESAVQESWTVTDETKAVQKAIDGITITREDAISQAQKLMDGLGISGLYLDSTEKAAFMPLATADYQMPVSFQGTDGAGYVIRYTRGSGGIAGHMDIGFPGEDVSGQYDYTPPYMQEQVIILVGEKGVVYFDWRGRVTGEKNVADNASILPADQVKTKLESWIAQTKETYISNNAQLVSMDVDVQSVKLGLCNLPVKGSTDSQLTPAWVFGVKELIHLTDGSTKTNYYDYTLNAQDGGIVSL